MKKKGFTLIELLAVIVILAIIALIATPLVLKYIETARTNSKITSTQNYMKAIENGLASYSINHKGKSYPEGCYEISTLNTDLDISIKGDIPTSGTICIEDNKIKKSIVKYPDNKIIKYEDDKSTVSDEETYEAFNSVSSHIIDEDLEFSFDETYNGYTATLSIAKEIAEQFAEGFDYDLVIDDGDSMLIYAVSYLDSDLMFYSHVTELSKLKGIKVNDEKITILSMEEMTGIHNVKITNKRPIEERTYFMIAQGGFISIVGYDFIAGNAKFLIKDEDGIEYYNDIVVLDDYSGNGIIGDLAGCGNSLPTLPDIYTALINGKTITIEITQTVNDKEVVSIISRNLNSMVDVGNGSNLYSRIYILLQEALKC